MATMTALAGVVPGFERRRSHQRSSLIDQALSPVIGRVQGLLLLHGGALGLGSEVGQHGSPGDSAVNCSGVGRFRAGSGVPEGTLKDCGLICPQLGVPGHFGFTGLAFSGLEVHDDQPALGIDLQTIHLAAEYRVPRVRCPWFARVNGIHVDIGQLDFKVMLDRQQAPSITAHEEHILGQLSDHELSPLEVELSLPVVFHAKGGPAPDKLCHVLGTGRLGELLGDAVHKGSQAAREIRGSLSSCGLNKPIKGRLVDGFDFRG